MNEKRNEKYYGMMQDERPKEMKQWFYEILWKVEEEKTNEMQCTWEDLFLNF